jgi:hypothetical protein
LEEESVTSPNEADMARGSSLVEVVALVLGNLGAEERRRVLRRSKARRQPPVFWSTTELPTGNEATTLVVGSTDEDGVAVGVDEVLQSVGRSEREGQRATEAGESKRQQRTLMTWMASFQARISCMWPTRSFEWPAWSIREP